MSFLGFARLFRSPVSLNRVYSVAFLPERVSKCGIASKKREHSKRPAAPFALFASQHYESTREENPGTKPQQVLGLLAEKWRDLSEVEKDGYRQEFAGKLAEFNAPLRKIPRRPPGAFAVFLRENYAAVESESPNANAPAIVKIVADKWKRLSVDEKEYLKQGYAEEKRKYDQRVVEFEGSLSKDEREFLEHVKGKKMQKLHKERLKLLDFPKRPASSFALFVSMEKSKFPRGTGEQITQWFSRMAKTWREMAEEEKEVYREERKKAFQKYGNDVIDWQSKNKL